MTSERISQLEAAIARHQAFLELPDLFTYVGMEGGTFTVPEQDWDPDNSRRDGSFYISEGEGDMCPSAQGYSYSFPPAKEKDLPVHFRDNTKGNVLEYISRTDIKTAKPFLLWENTTTQVYQLVLTEGRGYEGYYDPTIIVYPANGDFYMARTKNSPIEEIRKFKEFIRKNAKDELDSAKVSLQSYHSGLREEKADGERQQREAAELIRNRGMKI